MRTSFLQMFLLASLGATAVAAPRGNEYSDTFPAVGDLGNVMYVGDSITHGVVTPSYRWPLFKTWIDNGILHKEVGVNSGNYTRRQAKEGLFIGVTYGQSLFHNVHSAHVSERAYEVSGRNSNTERLEGSNIYDWLGLDATYNGNRRIDRATQTPDSYFLLLGREDTLFDAGKDGIGSCIEEKQKALLGKGGDMDLIIKAMREANPMARIAVMTLPTWGPERLYNSSPADYAAIQQYNTKLKEWAKARKVAVIDVNHGLTDVSTGAFIGPADLFTDDKLNLTSQADLIIAGNIAQQLGYAGRTAGLKRWPSKEFPLHMAALTKNEPGAKINKKGVLKLRGGFSYSANATETKDCTLQLSLTKSGFGNGAKGGWSKKSPLILELSTATSTGRLSINEFSIRWGEGWGRTLYSGDMSKIGEKPIRIAYTAGCPSQGVSAGYYVWLGDMLIGEGLNGGAPHNTGLHISCGEVSLARLDYDPDNAWAPMSSRFSNGNPLITERTAAPPPDQVPQSASNNGGSREEVCCGFSLCRGISTGNISIVLGEHASTPAEQNNPTAPNILCLGEHRGSLHLTIADNYTGSQVWGPFFAAANGKGIGGDASLTVNDDRFRVQSGKFGSVRCSLAGTFRSNVQGCVKFILNKGHYEGNIYGGDISKGQSTQIGSTHIELGAVSVAGDVCAGGLTGSIEGDAVIVLHGTAKVNGKLISGGNNVKGTRKLVLNKVETMPGATLADFDEIHITNSSKLTLGSLGGAKKLVVDSTSSLTLAPGSYEASVLNSGNIDISAGCTLSLRPEGTDENETGSYTVRGTLKTNNVRMSNTIRREGGKVEGLNEENLRKKQKKGRR